MSTADWPYDVVNYLAYGGLLVFILANSGSLQ